MSAPMVDRSLQIAPWIVAIALCGGCAVPDDAAIKSTKEKKKVTSTAKTADALPAEAPPDPRTEYAYSPVGKRDPFRSFLVELETGSGNRRRQTQEDTERYELDQYRLTGIITSTAQPMAMVEDPEGRGHVLRIGSRIGKNGGRITRILASEIIVTEEIRAPTGERVRVPIKVKLPQPELKLSIEP